MSPTLGKMQYLLLGKLLVMRHPEVAQRLLVQIEHDPPLTDLSRIPELYTVFCELINVDPPTFRGPLFSTNKVDIRRLFVSVILHLYNPQVYSHPSNNIIIPHNGFIKTLSEFFHVNRGYMSRFIRETIVMEKVYEEYRQKVEQIREGIINKTLPNGQS